MFHPSDFWWNFVLVISIKISHLRNTNHDEAYRAVGGEVLCYVAVFLKPGFDEHVFSTVHCDHTLQKPKINILTQSNENH